MSVRACGRWYVSPTACPKTSSLAWAVAVWERKDASLNQLLFHPWRTELSSPLASSLAVADNICMPAREFSHENTVEIPGLLQREPDALKVQDLSLETDGVYSKVATNLGNSFEEC